MPVVVTGASGFVGRAAASRFLDAGSEVRAIVRREEAAEPLRAAGAKVAVTWLENTEVLSAVMRDAHTVCHLVGGLDLPDAEAYDEANRRSTESVLEAAVEAKVSRFLFLSYPGASPWAPNPYLAAKGKAEDAVRSSGLEHVIVRATHVYGTGSEWLTRVSAVARAKVAVVVGTGAQVLAPVFVDDVAAVLLAADDRAHPVSGTFGLEGPDRVTADDLADLLAGRRRRKVHVSPNRARRLSRLAGRRLSPILLEVLAADSVADAPDAAAEFGVRTTPLQEGLAASRG